jgi:hypothetical protein
LVNFKTPNTALIRLPVSSLYDESLLITEVPAVPKYAVYILLNSCFTNLHFFIIDVCSCRLHFLTGVATVLLKSFIAIHRLNDSHNYLPAILKNSARNYHHRLNQLKNCSEKNIRTSGTEMNILR